MGKQRDKLKEMLKNRNPLLTAKREAVTPVDLYTKPQIDKQEEMLEKAVSAINKALDNKSIQVDKTTSGQTVKLVKPQVVKTVKPKVVKYTTHLKEETIKELKRYALDNDLKDYEAMQGSVEMYLKAKKED